MLSIFPSPRPYLRPPLSAFIGGRAAKERRREKVRGKRSLGEEEEEEIGKDLAWSGRNVSSKETRGVIYARGEALPHRSRSHLCAALTTKMPFSMSLTRIRVGAHRVSSRYYARSINGF